jgi:hypothetical protein
MKVQKLFSFVVGLSFVLQSSGAYAISAEEKDLLSRLEQVKERLKTSAGASAACEAPQAADCTLQSYCEKFDGKGRDFYLYQNEEGRQVPNFQMIAYTSSTDACLGKSNNNPLVKDPFVFPNQLTDAAVPGSPDQLNKNFLRYEAEQKRVQNIFTDAQERTVKVLTSRRTSENAEATDEMIKRIKAVELNFVKKNSELTELAKDGCDTPNAFYNPGTHQVTICPQMMNLPDAALFSVLSHEVGHSIDPCQATMNYTLNEKKISSDAPFSAAIGKVFIFKGIGENQNPFKDVVTCLQTEKSIAVAIPSLNESVKNAQQQLITGFGPNADYAVIASELEHEAKRVRQLYNSHKACHETTGNGHMQEAFSDWIASQTLKQKVSEIQETAKAQQYAFESQSFYIGLTCANLNQTAVAYLRPLIRNKCPALLEKMESADRPTSEGKSHPATAARVNRIMLATPEMQKALGCQKDESVSECPL